METLWQDLRYGVRMLIKNYGFALVAIITLALGIGANTAIFSVVNAVLLRPLAYSDPERLVTFRSNESVLDLADVKAWNQSFAEIGGNTIQPLDYVGSGDPVQWRAGLVTGDFFKTLGVSPLLGRVITTDDDKQGGPFLVVLSYSLWQQQFGGQSDIVGKRVTLSGNNYTVIGVMPADFKTPRDETDAWCPVRVVSPVAAVYRGVHFLRVYARLKPGVTLAQAQSEMSAIDKRLAEAFPAENKRRRTVLIGLHERVVGEVKPALMVMFFAVGLVLLIACANFANLLLARAAAREQELVVRVALGAERWRLTRQLLTESSLVALLGGAVGVLLALWGVSLLIALKPENLPRLDSISVDARVLLFTLALSLATGIIFGLAPAWHATRVNVSDALKEGGRGTAGTSRQRVRSALVVVEMAMALVLLIGAGLLIKSFWQLRTVKPGFNPDNLLTMRIDLPEARYLEIPKQTQYRRALLEEVNALPGVQTVIVSELPLSGEWLTHDFAVEGQQLAAGEEPDVQTRSIEGDYFRVMQIPLLAGRDFTPHDNKSAPQVGIVNESLAQRFFKGQNPLGKRVRWARGEPDDWITIIGVVGDIKHFALDDAEEPALYTPYPQSKSSWKRWINLVIRSQSDPATIVGAVKNRVWKIDGQIPVTRVRTMAEVIGASVAARRFNMLLLAIFAGVALLLTAVGIYGVIAYSVTQRTQEIGIRVALGARPRDVLGLIVAQGLLLALMGVSIGLIAAFGLTRLMSNLLYGVSATDAATFGLISLLLFFVSLIACYIPARQATKVDPMVALRNE
ncbi:MAG: ABC transporter permease [Acidobacteria bacterium]|nr:ABC transporter permease [Acidobacteriota bacterium]